MATCFDQLFKAQKIKKNYKKKNEREKKTTKILQFAFKCNNLLHAVYVQVR